MRTSCINHPANNRFSLLRQDYWDICETDELSQTARACAAKLLNVFEQWMNGKRQNVDQIKRYNKAATSEGLEIDIESETDLWIYESAEDLHNALISEHPIKTIRQALNWMVSQNLLLRRRNPKMRWDKTYQYALNVSTIQERINALILPTQLDRISPQATSCDMQATSIFPTGDSNTLDSFLDSNLDSNLDSEREEEAHSQKVLPELELKLTQDPIADEPEKEESQNFVLCLEIEEEGKVKTGGRNSKKKSSAAAPPKNSTSKPAAQPNLSDADCDRFVAAWNEVKPAHFIGMLALTDSKLSKSRKAIFESMVKESQSVDIAIAALQHYLRTSATDSYWRKDGFKPKLENLASNEKLDLAAQYYRINLEPTPIAAPSASPEISDEPNFQPQANNATERFENQFKNPQRHVGLIESGHGDIMIGKGLLDFDPTLVEVAILHLKKCKLPFEVLDAKRFILNRIRQADWAAIELLKESAATIAGDRQKTEAAIAASANSGSEYYDTSRYYIPEPPVIDLEARAKATEGGRAKMRETIAQALKNRAS